MLSRLFIAALCSPAGKVLDCDFVTFPRGILGQAWYLVVLIPDLCRLSDFYYTFNDILSCNEALKVVL